MRLRRISFRGLTRFTDADPVHVDFDDLGPGLVALVGQNGAGKTTAMEAVAAGLYRGFPSRPGSLYEAAHGRDAFIELVFDDDYEDVTVRLMIDAERRSTEGYVTVCGEPVTGGKAGAFDQAIADRFGSRDLFLASVFAAQNKAGDFLAKKKGDRKALFVELLGLGYLEDLATMARAMGGNDKAQLDRTRERVANLERECSIGPDVQADLARASAEVRSCTADLDAARQREREAVQAREDIKAAAGQVAALRSVDRAAALRLAGAQRALDDAGALAPAARQRAEERIAAIEARGAEGLEEEVRGRHARAIEALAQTKHRAEEVMGRKKEIDEARTRLQQALKEKALLADQIARAGELRLATKIAERDLETAQAALEKAADIRLEHMAALRHRAGLLEDVPCYGELAATCPLLAEARDARKKLTVMGVQAGCADERAAAKTAAEHWAQAQQEQARYPNETELKDEQETLLEEIDLLGRVVPLHAMVDRAEAELAAVEEQKRQLETQLAADLERAAAAAEMAAAERIGVDAELHRELLAAAKREAAALVARDDAEQAAAAARVALEEAEERIGRGGLEEAEQAVSAAHETATRIERQLQAGQQAQARAQARLEALDEKRAEITSLRRETERTQDAVSDWALLSAALGKDGIQALEVDAAGPEVASLTNELLDSCYGPRFSISFETLREKKSKRGEYSEVFDIRVFDDGVDRPVEALSGGEKVIVGEAVHLALAIYNARKSGVRWETLFRDETAGALDPDNATKYVAMLRRAMVLGGFAQVIFVAHLPEVWERADAQVMFEDGKVTVAA